MNKETKILLAILIPMFALLFLFGSGGEDQAEPKREFSTYTLNSGVIVCNSQSAAEEMLKAGKKNDVDGIQELVDSLICYETGADVHYKMKSVRNDIVGIQISHEDIEDRKAFVPEVVLREYTSAK